MRADAPSTRSQHSHVDDSDSGDPDNDLNDPTAPFNELKSFDSIWQGLRWNEIRTRVPVCFRKTIRNRYFFANLVFLGYAIGILIIDFNPTLYDSSSTDGTATTTIIIPTTTIVNQSSASTTTQVITTTAAIPVLDQAVQNIPYVNHLYIGFAVVHLVSAFLYWWAWKDRSWLDIILIPDYLNHIEAGLYLWSSTWYSREDTLGGFYTLRIHKIEITAAVVELVASFGWIGSWYLTYIRTLGRGFSLDDPDTIAYLSNTIASIIYLVYNIQINVDPSQYGTNYLYTNGDLLYFIAACFYTFASLRDDHWFWFLPVAGQYGVAPGSIQTHSSKVLPHDGRPIVLITDPCTTRRRKDMKIEKQQLNVLDSCMKRLYLQFFVYARKSQEVNTSTQVAVNQYMADSNIPPKKSNRKDTNRPELLSLDAAQLFTVTSASADISSLRLTQKNHESVVFIWFDPSEQSSLNMVGQLRVINDIVRSFADWTTCSVEVKSSQERIFFLTSSIDPEILATIQECAVVEGIFVLHPNVESIKGDFPKLFGIFHQQEEFFRVLKEVFDIFEQVQLETFVFEEEKIFLWSQLWKEDIINRKVSLKKTNFIDVTRQYYRDNLMIIRSIDELDKSYRPTEVLHWCSRSPFPSRFLEHALRSQNKEQLNISRGLHADAARFFQQQTKPKSSEQFYRGMKLSNEQLERFEAHLGRLLCTSGFFICTKSRTHALSLASLPAYRTDLSPVLFKVNCDSSSLYSEVVNKVSTIMFDCCAAFRVIYVNRGPMTVIKMKTDHQYGKKIALDYLEQHKDEKIQVLMTELLKPPTPPPKPPTPPPSNQKRNVGVSSEEIKAQKCVEKGEIDRALAIYGRIQPITAHILNTMGQLCTEKKGDYQYAMQCHTQALQIQEETGEDTADTLTDLGNVYQNWKKYDLAQDCHARALAIRQSHSSPDQSAVATNLIGIGNSHWARREYSQAIDYTQRALTLRENVDPPNEASVAATLAVLGNIYQDDGNNTVGVDLCKRALAIFERTGFVDSPILAEVLFNMGIMQKSLGLFDEAYQSFERTVKIYRRLLPQGHPDRLAAEEELRRVIQNNPKAKSNLRKH